MHSIDDAIKDWRGINQGLKQRVTSNCNLKDTERNVKERPRFTIPNEQNVLLMLLPEALEENVRKKSSKNSTKFTNFSILVLGLQL